MRDLSFFLRRPARLPVALLARVPAFSFLRETSDYQNPVTFGLWFAQKVCNLGGNRGAYWPVCPQSQVYDAENIYVGVDTCPGIMKGCYIQGKGGIWIGDYTQVAPNVAIVSANHDVYDLRKQIVSPVRIGDYSWIGANASVMPGVTLGDFTVVGAGAVVTTSFPEGFCVLAGNPARKIRDLDKTACRPHRCRVEYHGYVRRDRFAAFQRRYLNVQDIFGDTATVSTVQRRGDRHQ